MNVDIEYRYVEHRVREECAIEDRLQICIKVDMCRRDVRFLLLIQSPFRNLISAPSEPR